MQSDINWRDIHEDDSIFRKQNCARAILVVTDVNNIRETVTSRVSPFNYIDASSEERVIKYAFI